MKTVVDEIATDIYRISTYMPNSLAYNQFLIVAEEPALFHTGMRVIFPAVRDAVARVIAPSRLRWITFGHYEADECGAMNEWLQVAPEATVAQGALGVGLSIADQAIRAPRALRDGEIVDLGGKRMRYIATPHVPHGWDAGLFYEDATKTLFAGDLFTRTGDGPAMTDGDIVTPAFELEGDGIATALTPSTAPTIRALAGFDITTLALMHAPAFNGDARAALNALADGFAQRLDRAYQRGGGDVT